MKKTAQNKTLLLICVVCIVIIAASLIYLQFMSPQTSDQKLAALPPVSQRTNPEPTTGNTISVASVNPGNKLTVESVSFEQGGYIYAYKDALNGKRSLIGKSALLSKGPQSNISLALTSQVKDGDVIYLVLVNSKGEAIKDENQNTIEVQKNVGMLMNHYQSEY